MRNRSGASAQEQVNRRTREDERQALERTSKAAAFILNGQDERHGDPALRDTRHGSKDAVRRGSPCTLPALGALELDMVSRPKGKAKAG